MKEKFILNGLENKKNVYLVKRENGKIYKYYLDGRVEEADTEEEKFILSDSTDYLLHSTKKRNKKKKSGNKEN